MRSRYSAFALGRFDYLEATQLAPFEGGEPQVWVCLTVHRAAEDQVEFTARYLEGEKLVSLHERSHFVRREGRWLYAGGSPQVSTARVGRNEPCPCGSGKKLKSCHA